MMRGPLALLHTTPLTIQPMASLARERFPSLALINLLDDSLLPEVRRAGAPTAAVEQRVRAYVEQAAVAGAAGLLCCCSSIGEVAESTRAGSQIPVLRIDEPMAEEAVASGRRIGVIATLPTTLEPTARLIQRKADQRGDGSAAIETVVVDGAFAALAAGQPERHDELVRAALLGLLERSDVVVLAQASMARLLPALDPPPSVPVLSSPLSGLRRAAVQLGHLEVQG